MTDPTDETFMAKCTVLKEVVEHHVEEEEDEYFPKVKKALGKERMVELGEELKAAFEELEDGAPAKAPQPRPARTRIGAAGIRLTGLRMAACGPGCFRRSRNRKRCVRTACG